MSRTRTQTSKQFGLDAFELGGRTNRYQAATVRLNGLERPLIDVGYAHLSSADLGQMFARYQKERAR